ncbi:hypothetical protein PHYC_01174 [Phycisphaerales bacterium]|nr:hypothetical protein PHYC_01174 [Phycisphaerales bacterium]
MPYSRFMFCTESPTNATSPAPALTPREKALLAQFAAVGFNLPALLQDPNFTNDDFIAFTSSPALHHHLALITSLTLQGLTLRAIQARITAINELEHAAKAATNPQEKSIAARALLRATSAPLIPTRRDPESGLLIPSSPRGEVPSPRGGGGSSRRDSDTGFPLSRPPRDPNSLPAEGRAGEGSAEHPKPSTSRAAHAASEDTHPTTPTTLMSPMSPMTPIGPTPTPANHHNGAPPSPSELSNLNSEISDPAPPSAPAATSGSSLTTRRPDDLTASPSASLRAHCASARNDFGDDDTPEDLALDREAAAYGAQLGVSLLHPEILTAIRDGRAHEVESIAARIRAEQPQAP